MRQALGARAALTPQLTTPSGLDGIAYASNDVLKPSKALVTVGVTGGNAVGLELWGLAKGTWGLVFVLNGGGALAAGEAINVTAQDVGVYERLALMYAVGSGTPVLTVSITEVLESGQRGD